MAALRPVPPLQSLMGDRPRESTSPGEDREAAVKWLYAERERLLQLRERVKNFVASKVEVLDQAQVSSEAEPKFRATRSSPDNSINCRITLSPVPVGDLALSPCNCRGTNEVFFFFSFFFPHCYLACSYLTIIFSG